MKIKTDYERLWFYENRRVEKQLARLERANQKGSGTPILLLPVKLVFGLLAYVVHLVRLAGLNLRVKRPLFYVVAVAVGLVAVLLGAVLFEGSMRLLFLVLGLYLLVRAVLYVGWKKRLVGRVPLFVPYIPLKRRLSDRLYRVLDSVYGVLKETIARDYTVKAMVNNFELSPADADGIYRLDLVTPRGETDETLLRRLPDVFAADIHAVRVIPLDADPRQGFISLLICETNPLDASLPVETCPVLNLSKEDRANPYLWLPVGINSIAEPMKLPLFLPDQGSMRYLQCGESGSGKSSILRQQILFAVQNPYIDVIITDGKGSEFGMFDGYVKDYLAFDPNDLDAFDLHLALVESEITRRGKELNENKKRDGKRETETWNHHDDGNYLLWAWDELGRVQGAMNKKQQDDLQKRIFGIVSVARSLGVSVIFSSQTFKADILSTQSRNNGFNMAVGYKLNSLMDSSFVGFDMSDTVRPDLIKGAYLESGILSCVGQFAVRGLGSNDYGKSYFLGTDLIRDFLKTVKTSQ